MDRGQREKKSEVKSKEGTEGQLKKDWQENVFTRNEGKKDV